MKKDDKITVMKEYVSNQTVNAFMRHGVEKYFHEYIIVIDDDWYTPCEFISEFGLEDSFGSEYVFEQVVIAVKSSIKWLKKQGFKPDEDSDDESYNLYMMIDFIKNIKDSNQLNEKRIELPNPYPVKKDEIIDLIERSSRLIHTVTDSKTIQIYIYSNGNDRPEALAEVEITSVGYILHGAEGYDYQGNSLKEFDNDLNDVVFHFDATKPKRVKESINEGDKFKNKNGAVIEIIEYDEDENYVLYKVNDDFHDTHIDSIENILSKNGYEKLNEDDGELYFGESEAKLYEKILQKYYI